MEIVIGIIGFIIICFVGDRVGFAMGRYWKGFRSGFKEGEFEVRFSIYKEDVDDFIEYIQVHIPEVNEATLKIASLNKQTGNTSDYTDYLDISPNFKKLTKDDYMKIALHSKYYFVFDILVSIYKDLLREFEEGKDDFKSKNAGNALIFLEPDNINMAGFMDIIEEVDHATSSIRDAYRERRIKEYKN